LDRSALFLFRATVDDFLGSFGMNHRRPARRQPIAVDVLQIVERASISEVRYFELIPRPEEAQ